MDTHSSTRPLRAWLGAVTGCALVATLARAEPRELNARVVWTRGDLIYVATPDSGVLEPGLSLTVLHGRRTLASGAVVQVLEPRLAIARLSSGSLARERHIERLHVRGEAATPPPVPVLRVGLPGRGRASLLFACSWVSLSSRFGAASGRVDSLARDSFRWVRDPLLPAAAGTPDTLLVHLFVDAADQEIALERGELDAAVFWPGELSARMRADPRWRDAARGLRARGVLACVAASSDTAAPPLAALDGLNREAFAGDLLPWRELEPEPPASTLGTPRFTADPALPGARVLEAVLARSNAGPGARLVRLAYLDVPLAAHDSALSTWRTRGVTPAFAVRCPVLAAPAARAIVQRIGADAFANLGTCTGNAP